MAKRPKQKTLPTMEDSVIQPIESAAHAYVEARDERMDASEIESKRKQALLGLMKKHNKTHYKRNGLEIDVIVEAETVKVRQKKAKPE